MPRAQALYRFLDDSGTLLYVGITNNPSTRFQKHQRSKPWWHEVATIKLETFPTREEVLEAERAAIVSERPLYNVVHNGAARHACSRDAGRPQEPTWVYSTRHGFAHRGPIWLTFELAGEPIVDDLHGMSGHDQVRHWLRWVRESGRAKDGLVGVAWFVVAPHGIEMPPSSLYEDPHDDDRVWETFFSVPVNERTGEPIDWRALEVRHDRFPEFDAALGWRPEPFTKSFSVDAAMDGSRA